MHGEYPHDHTSYTQGLIWHDGKLYESTGQHGQSSLRRVDPQTGLTEAKRELSTLQFGEGLARVEDRLIQLTWRAGQAFAYDLETLEVVGQHSYEGEGWGLCYDGRRLVMSDGSSDIYFRDPETFDVLDRLTVTIDDRPIQRLNELECAEGWIYANVYQTDSIVRIDPGSGRVVAVIDAAGLLSTEDSVGVDVLNGIAYDPDRAIFYLTGKLWPKVFEVTFEESH